LVWKFGSFVVDFFYDDGTIFWIFDFWHVNVIPIFREARVDSGKKSQTVGSIVGWTGSVVSRLDSTRHAELNFQVPAWAKVESMLDLLLVLFP
jgi:hypothetical protein